MKPALDDNRRLSELRALSGSSRTFRPQLSKFIRRHATTESALVAILQPILHLDSNYLNIWALKLNSCCPE